MAKTLCITSRLSVGVTFMLWSYYWLSGFDKHYLSKQDALIDLVSDPNTSVNAHLFKKNIFGNWQDISIEINKYQKLSHPTTVAFYAGFFPKEDTEQDLMDSGYADIVNELLLHKVPTVLVIESSTDTLYSVKQRSINPLDTHSPIDTKDHLDWSTNNLIDFLQCYFFQNQNIRDLPIWDQRELIALNYQHLVQCPQYADKIDFTQSHFYLDSRELWYDGEHSMRRIFQWLDEYIDETRIPQWRQAYIRWQQVHFDILRFGWLLSHVIDCVINGYDYDLASLNLDLAKEAIIQGHLLHHHAMNLKTFGIDKFPRNTKELHRLLEPNVLHSI